MRKLLIFLSAIFICLNAAPFVYAEGSSSSEQELINLGLKFLDNPGDFFFNLHMDNEDFSPLPTGRHASLRTNFFPTTFPLTWMNLNLKVNALKDRGYMPQVDLVGMYGDLVGLRAAKSSMDDVDPVFSDYAVGLVISKSATEKTKIFGGMKYASVNMTVKLSSSSVIEEGAFRLDSLDFKVADTFFFTGISHKSGKNSYVVAQAGYGFKYKKIISRIMVSHSHLELGMDIFPEGLFVIHPFMAWHWYF